MIEAKHEPRLIGTSDFSEPVPFSAVILEALHDLFDPGLSRPYLNSTQSPATLGHHRLCCCLSLLLCCCCAAVVLLVWCACGGFDDGGSAAVAFV